MEAYNDEDFQEVLLGFKRSFSSWSCGNPFYSSGETDLERNRLLLEFFGGRDTVTLHAAITPLDNRADYAAWMEQADLAAERLAFGARLGIVEHNFRAGSLGPDVLFRLIDRRNQFSEILPMLRVINPNLPRKEVDAYLRKETMRLARAEKRLTAKRMICVEIQLESLLEKHPSARLPADLTYMQVGDLDLICNYPDVILSEAAKGSAKATSIIEALRLAWQFSTVDEDVEKDDRGAVMVVGEDDADAMDWF